MLPIEFLLGATLTTIVILALVAYYALGKTFQGLAHSDRGLTFVKEGQGKLIFINGKLSRPLGSLPGYCRAYELKDFAPVADERDKWTWVTDTRHHIHFMPKWMRWLNDLNLFKGIAFIGFGKVYLYDFRWTRAHLARPARGEVEVISNDRSAGKMVIAAEELKQIDYIFINDVVYHVAIPEPETKAGERLPLDIGFTLTVRIVNEIKAILGAHQWFETLVQRFIPSAKDFIGSRDYDDLIDLHKDKAVLTADNYFKVFVNEMLRDYGICIEKIQVYSVAPHPEQLEATVAVYRATQDAKVKKIIAEGERDAIALVYGAIEKHPHGVAIELARAIRDTKVTTLVLGGSTSPALSIPTTTPDPKTISP
jgi:hypothetical protein